MGQNQTFLQKVQRSVRSYPNPTKIFRRALKASVPSVPNSVMHLGEEIQTTEDNTELVCVTPNWNTATEVMNCQHPSDSEQKSYMSISLGCQRFCSNHYLIK